MADALSKYRSMRNFEATPEPEGKVARRTTKGFAYVVQKHEASRLHYDFRLELDGVLLSWAVAKGPSLNPADKRLAVRTEDHPLAYGDFEGVIPSGYGAGAVILWDAGSWTPAGDPHHGLKKGALKFTLHGKRLKGGFALVRMRNQSPQKRENWLLIKERDEHASEDVLAVGRWTKSVKSGRSIEEVAGLGGDRRHAKRAASRKKTDAACSPKAAREHTFRRAPAFIEPQLALLHDKPPEGEGWLHETKFDGYRIIAVIHRGRVRLFTRNKKDWTTRYRRIADALSELKMRDGVIDGELIALGKDGKANFSLMQRAGEDEGIRLAYYAFDLLNENGRDLRPLPLTERKAKLEGLIGEGSAQIRYSRHVRGNGDEVVAAACEQGLEGVVSKKTDAPYRSGRGPNWIKSKCIGRDEFVVGGYRLSDKSGRAFRSLLLGEFEKGKLTYRGRVGAGFNEETFNALQPALSRLKRKTSPFANTPNDVRKGVVWVSPRVVVQVSYLETTPDGLLRHPSYLGLREDKPAEGVKVGTSSVSKAAKEAPASDAKAVMPPAKAARKPMAKKAEAKTPAVKAAPHAAKNDNILGVRLSSPNKQLWPEAAVTKHDLAIYYATNADRLMAHVKDRPLSIVRCPEGHAGECFFQKHHNPSTPDAIETVEIKEKDGGSAEYLVIRKPAGLVGAAQIGGLELHVWGSRIDSLEKPERIVFDLDPDEGLDFNDVKTAAAEVRNTLKAAGLESFPMLTGGKGVHVIAPIARTREWPEVKAFARGFARAMEQAAPQRYLSQASKTKRKGRIFLDWLRNERGSTAIAPFSPRARDGAPVATPISWQELKTLKAADVFTLANIDQRLSKLKSDPWRDYATLRQSVTSAAMAALAD